MEDKKIRTALTVITFAISVLGLIVGFRIMAGYEDIVGTAITFTMILMAIAAGAALLFAIYQLATNIKRNVPLLIAIIGFVVIGFISYALASDSTVGYDDDITATASKLSDTGIILMYVLVLGAVGAAVVGEIARAFK